jgi:hypothetical protein
VTANVDIGHGLFDLRHVTRDAFAARAFGAMMRVRFEGRSVWTVR